MTAADAGTPRERYRAQVRDEVKLHAREQIAAAGASALSLNAIAKRMGMSGPALYRYFANRDELITELVKDAYRSLADAVRDAPEGAGVAEFAHVLRAWALEDRQRYFLVYGTPIPGYEAPEDTTLIASEIMAVLLRACAAEPPAAPGTAAPDTTALDAHLAGHRAWAPDPAVPAAALSRALAVWTRLHGVLSLELSGHFVGMGFDPAELFAAEVRSLTGR
ncbi:TetR/AcrR family transcriptional regulator [Streptomyces fuscigenes]|uniref:TetR/AcrR family transcriptional regulator n=1 Tax=Streptomyces fuscigenes TaxID=1528880 RepID=UPI001F46EB9A|nr:TetR/AcrR family transcriptional regulator [Streptomyces fuscigenes]MCF3963120.1 TetR/AcrR family transcriptional regulator [Streptomyces fuscigenes]